jgi:hypothetical protein
MKDGRSEVGDTAKKVDEASRDALRTRSSGPGTQKGNDSRSFNADSTFDRPTDQATRDDRGSLDHAENQGASDRMNSGTSLDDRSSSSEATKGSTS